MVHCALNTDLGSIAVTQSCLRFRAWSAIKSVAHHSLFPPAPKTQNHFISKKMSTRHIFACFLRSVLYEIKETHNHNQSLFGLSKHVDNPKCRSYYVLASIFDIDTPLVMVEMDTFKCEMASRKYFTSASTWLRFCEKYYM